MSTFIFLGVIALRGHQTGAFTDFYHLKNILIISAIYGLFEQFIDYFKNRLIERHLNL